MGRVSGTLKPNLIPGVEVIVEGTWTLEWEPNPPDVVRYKEGIRVRLTLTVTKAVLKIPEGTFPCRTGIVDLSGENIKSVEKTWRLGEPCTVETTAFVPYASAGSYRNAFWFHVESEVHGKLYVLSKAEGTYSYRYSVLPREVRVEIAEVKWNGEAFRVKFRTNVPTPWGRYIERILVDGEPATYHAPDTVVVDAAGGTTHTLEIRWNDGVASAVTRTTFTLPDVDPKGGIEAVDVPSEWTPGSRFPVRFRVVNRGKSRGTIWYRVYADGKLHKSGSYELDPGAGREVTTGILFPAGADRVVVRIEAGRGRVTTASVERVVRAKAPEVKMKVVIVGVTPERLERTVHEEVGFLVDVKNDSAVRGWGWLKGWIEGIGAEKLVRHWFEAGQRSRLGVGFGYVDAHGTYTVVFASGHYEDDRMVEDDRRTAVLVVRAPTAPSKMEITHLSYPTVPVPEGTRFRVEVRVKLIEPVRLPVPATVKIVEKATGRVLASEMFHFSRRGEEKSFILTLTAPTRAMDWRLVCELWDRGVSPYLIADSREFTVRIGARPEETGNLEGYVVDATTGRGILGATVTCAGKSAKTDARGYYLLTGIPTGTHTATASHPEYRSQSKRVTVSAGATARCDFRLTRIGVPPPPAPPTPVAEIVEVITPKEARSGEKINVKVVLKNVGASGRIWIEALYDTRKFSEREYSIPSGGTLTAFIGSFIMPDRGVTVTVSAGHYKDMEKVVDDRKFVKIEVLVVARRGVIHGVVRDARTGEPLEGASITIDAYATRTDREGRYRVEVTPGTYTVEVSMKGYGTQRRRVTVGAGETVRCDFDLRKVVVPLPYWPILIPIGVIGVKKLEEWLRRR